jgi:large subunit ribosomal protein L2
MFSILFYKKPSSPGIRHQVFLRKYLFSFFYFKKLIYLLSYTAGRNNSGKLTVRHKRKKIVKHKLLINKNYNFYNYIPFKINLILYDCYINNFIMLLKSNNGIFFYRNYVDGLFINNILYSYKNIPSLLAPGSICKLKYLPEGLSISNLELYPGKGSQLFRSAGTGTNVISKDIINNKIAIKLCTNKIINISIYCTGIIGRNSNSLYFQHTIGKAGRAFNKGIRPTVRGVAMNPVDHPHGGGEGKKSKKAIPHSPWGKVYKFKKTNKKLIFK